MIQQNDIDLINRVIEAKSSASTLLGRAVAELNFWAVKIICESMHKSPSISYLTSAICQISQGSMGQRSIGQWSTDQLPQSKISRCIETIKILCKHGIELDRSQTELNTMSCVVRTCNLKLIELLYNYKRNVPSLNISMSESNTLSLAVDTKNITIVNMICDSGGLPNVSNSIHNTLYKAMLTMDPEIIKSIIKKGGVPTHGKKKLHDSNCNYASIITETG